MGSSERDHAHGDDQTWCSAEYEVFLVSVIMPMVMMAVCAYGFELWWGGAAVGGLAAFDLELDGGVADVELVAQGLVEAFEDAAAIGYRHVGYSDVAGEGDGAGA